MVYLGYWIHGPGCVPGLLSFQESIYSLDSVSWNLAIPGYIIRRIIGFIEENLS